MGLRQIEAVSRHLLEAGRDPSEPVAFLTDGTTSVQRRMTTTLEEATDAARHIDHQGPTLIVIGEVVDFEDILSPLQQTMPATVPSILPEATPAVPAERGLS
jgi:siroheme synthase